MIPFALNYIKPCNLHWKYHRQVPRWLLYWPSITSVNDVFHKVGTPRNILLHREDTFISAEKTMDLCTLTIAFTFCIGIK